MNDKAKRIREMMLELNLKQKEIAETCGFSSQYVSAVVGGKSPVSDRFIELLAHHYSVSIEWLTLGVGEMFKPVVDSEPIKDMDSVLGKFFADIIGREDTDRMKMLVYYLAGIDRERKI